MEEFLNLLLYHDSLRIKLSKALIRASLSQNYKTHTFNTDVVWYSSLICLNSHLTVVKPHRLWVQIWLKKKRLKWNLRSALNLGLFSSPSSLRQQTEFFQLNLMFSRNICYYTENGRVNLPRCNLIPRKNLIPLILPFLHIFYDFIAESGWIHVYVDE